MSRRWLSAGPRARVFHLRLSGCCGCGDVVDMLLRGRFKECPGIVECSSPRHAGLVVVTGLWNEELLAPGLAVIGQAPTSRKVMFAGDCALGRGPFAERIKHLGIAPEGLDVDAAVAGCPFSIEALSEGIRDVVS